MNVTSVDLNLFSVLHAVLSERSVTQAAKRLHVTQSAVSNSLGRLREIFGDPLVVRKGRAMVLTPRAEDLAPIISAGLASLEKAIQGSRQFVPGNTTRTFTLAAADNHQACDVPLIAARVARGMPHAVLRIVSPDYLLSSDGLAEGGIDVALGPAVPVRPPLYSEKACVETGALVVKRDHSSLKRQMSREAFNTLKHIDIEIAQGRPGTGHRMAQPIWLRQGLRREVALCVPNFAAALMVAARTEYVATVPRRTAEVFCKMLPLKIVEADFELPSIDMALTWHSRTDADAGSRYFRKLVLRCLRSHDS